MSNFDQISTWAHARIGPYAKRGHSPGGTHTFTQEGNIMNADQLKGKWKQFKGELKEKWGKFTDDDLQQIEGNYEKFVGKAQERYGDKKDELMKWADQWHQKATPDDIKTRM
jgi:uncharacterized protein YjbJ (UPF0337 family)